MAVNAVAAATFSPTSATNAATNSTPYNATAVTTTPSPLPAAAAAAAAATTTKRRERKHHMPHYQTGVTVLKGICKQLSFSNRPQIMTDSNGLFIHLFNAPKPL